MMTNPKIGDTVECFDPDTMDLSTRLNWKVTGREWGHYELGWLYTVKEVREGRGARRTRQISSADLFYCANGHRAGKAQWDAWRDEMCAENAAAAAAKDTETKATIAEVAQEGLSEREMDQIAIEAHNQAEDAEADRPASLDYSPDDEDARTINAVASMVERTYPAFDLVDLPDVTTTWQSMIGLELGVAMVGTQAVVTLKKRDTIIGWRVVPSTVEAISREIRLVLTEAREMFLALAHDLTPEAVAQYPSLAKARDQDLSAVATLTPKTLRKA